MKKAVNATEALYYKIPSNRIVFGFLALILVSLFVVYAYLVNKAVLNVVAREKTEDQISDLSGTVGQMEYQDITLRDGITMQLADSYGLQEVTASQFLSRTSEPSALSYNYR